jgi:hypothetical protein
MIFELKELQCFSLLFSRCFVKFKLSKINFLNYSPNSGMDFFTEKYMNIEDSLNKKIIP